MRKKIYVVILLSVVVLSLYFPIFKNFFQQDEWAAFADIYALGFRQYILRALVPDPGHYVPFARILISASLYFFKLDYFKWALVSTLWHIINSYLVFLLAEKIFKKSWQAIFSGILFAVFASGHQATTWVVANSATQGATTFVIISLILFFQHRTYLSVLMLLVSMLFKEIAIGMFVFYPLLILVQNYINKKKLFDQKIFSFLIVAILYIVFRYLTLIGIFSDIKAPVVTESQTRSEIIYNLSSFPIKGVSQTAIPPFLFVKISKFIAEKMPDGIAGLPGTSYFDNYYLRYVLGLLTYIVFGVVILVSLVAFKVNRGKNIVIAFISLLFIGINSSIYALSPGRSGFVPIIDSRNLYLPAIGMAIFLVAILYRFRSCVVSFFILMIFISMNSIVTRIEITNLSNVGKDRERILNQILRDNLKLENKQIFFVTSDTSYYGLPDNVRILPFQSGFGQTLLVWYYETEKFPKKFLEEGYLWPIDSQGYMEIESRGFGYIRDFSLLKDTVREYNLPVESVVAYSWNSREVKLTNITEEIRLKLKSVKK